MGMTIFMVFAKCFSELDFHPILPNETVPPDENAWFVTFGMVGTEINRARESAAPGS
jgi:hypothetical protein